MKFEPGDRVYAVGSMYVADPPPWFVSTGQRGTIVSRSVQWHDSYFVKFDTDANEHLLAAIMLKSVPALEQLASVAL